MWTDTRSEVVFGLWALCCVLVAIPATCVFPYRSVWLLPHSRSSKFLAKRWAAMVSKRKRGSPGFQDRFAEKVLADAITNDGRQEWICKFCSESNVWTRWCCRRCYSDILAGLHAGEVQTGSFDENQEVVIWIVILEWKKKESPRPECGDSRVASAG